MKTRVCGGALALAALSLTAAAQMVNVEVTNNQPSGGFSFSPLWFAFHDGTFDMFNAGSAASQGIEDIAELANATALGMEFATSGASGVSGLVASTDAVPPFSPGESNSMMFNVGDSMANRYFSFASMLVPSNDFFLGNDNPMGYEIFDASGSFLGPVTIMIYSDDAWDAGTEVNDLANGPAFIVGQDAHLGATENGVITPLFSTPGVNTYLAAIVGMQTPIGVLTDGLDSGELLATVTITPEPSSLLGLVLLGAAAAWRRR